MKYALFLAIGILAGCGGNEPHRGYLRGTWTQGPATANIRLWDFGDRIEGWTDDGRRVSGNWPRLVLTPPQEPAQEWDRIGGMEYRFGAETAILKVKP